MVVTKSCKTCGDELVIETLVVGLRTPILITALPAALGDERGTGSIDLDGYTAGDAVLSLYGLIAIPENVTRPAWVVSQYTNLGQLSGHKLHHVHRCPDGAVLEEQARETVAA